MNYTQHYQLPQWVESDRILRTDFNDSYSKLDAALKTNADGLAAETAARTAKDTEHSGFGNCGVYVTTYVGTNSNQPVSFTLPAKPVAFIVTELLGGRYALALRGVTNIPCAPGSSVSMEVTWGDNQVSWYEGNADNGFNDARFTYCLVALLDKTV